MSVKLRCDREALDVWWRAVSARNAGLIKQTSAEKGAGPAAVAELLAQVQDTLKNARPKQDAHALRRSK